MFNAILADGKYKGFTLGLAGLVHEGTLTKKQALEVMRRDIIKAIDAAKARLQETDNMLAEEAGQAAFAFAHKSDCAVHNAPAYEAGPCDCGAEKKPRIAELVEDKLAAGAYRVECIEEDGGVEVTLFSGPNAKERAIAFAGGPWYDGWSDPQGWATPASEPMSAPFKDTL